MNPADGVTVVEIFIPWNGPPLSQYFTPEVCALFHPCPDEVQVDWTWDSVNDTYAPPISQQTDATGAGGGQQRPPV